MRFFAYVLLVAAAAAGCGDTAATTLSVDAGGDGAIDPDGGIDFRDGSVDDAGADASMQPDGGAGGDGGSSGGGGSGGSGSWCTTSTLCPSCPDLDALCDPGDSSSCPIGEICLSTGCEGVSRCFVTGLGGCLNDGDCRAPAYACNQSIGRCLRVNPGCDDSNDCVAGFACENNACVDRRVPCGTGSDCPHGFTCFFAGPDQRFCRRINRPCTDDADCLVLGVRCGDADENGFKECMPWLTANAPVPCSKMQCTEPAAPVCEPVVEGTLAVCGQFGPCLVKEDCSTGFECQDLWGDGRAECVLPAGSCVDSSDCDDRNVCASPRAGGPPACVGGATM